VTNQWTGGFDASVTITDTGSTAVNDWSPSWTFLDCRANSFVEFQLPELRRLRCVPGTMLLTGATPPRASSERGRVVNDAAGAGVSRARLLAAQRVCARRKAPESGA